MNSNKWNMANVNFLTFDLCSNKSISSVSLRLRSIAMPTMGLNGMNLNEWQMKIDITRNTIVKCAFRMIHLNKREMRQAIFCWVHSFAITKDKAATISNIRQRKIIRNVHNLRIVCMLSLLAYSITNIFDEFRRQ